MSQLEKFFLVIVIGIALIALQGFCAWRDGFWSQLQIAKERGIHAYSFLQHGGMWCDVLVVTPIVAWIISRYRLPYLELSGLVILVIALIFSLYMGSKYQEWAKTMPEAYTHDGRTTAAGWIHGLFAVAVLWVCVMFYATRVQPQPGVDMLIVSVGLTALFILGVMKFHPDWRWRMQDTFQVGGCVIVIWVITAWKMMR